jgi:hypothetical protein
MAETTQDLVIEQYADWDQEFRWIDTSESGVSAPADLTGVDLKCQIRDSSRNLVAELTPGNGGIVIVDAAGGVFKLVMPYTRTATLDFTRGNWDILAVRAGKRVRYAEGSVVFSRGVTQP